MHIARALHRNAIDKVVDPLLIFVKDLVLRSAKPARRKAVNGDAVRAPVIGQAHGQLAYAAAARSIGRQTRITEDAGDGADVDDAAVTMLHHAARDGLCDEEAAAQIRVE